MVASGAVEVGDGLERDFCWLEAFIVGDYDFGG